MKKEKFVLTEKGAICITGYKGEPFKPIDEWQKTVFLEEGLIRKA